MTLITKRYFNITIMLNCGKMMKILPSLLQFCSIFLRYKVLYITNIGLIISLVLNVNVKEFSHFFMSCVVMTLIHYILDLWFRVKRFVRDTYILIASMYWKHFLKFTHQLLCLHTQSFWLLLLNLLKFKNQLQFYRTLFI